MVGVGTADHLEALDRNRRSIGTDKASVAGKALYDLRAITAAAYRPTPTGAWAADRIELPGGADDPSTEHAGRGVSDEDRRREDDHETDANQDISKTQTPFTEPIGPHQMPHANPPLRHRVSEPRT
jgi:hypothetical protein